MDELSDKQCIPCKGGVPPLSASEMAPLLTQLNPDWQIVDGHHLFRIWIFDDFKDALQFLYGELMLMLEDIADSELYDSVEQIYLTELRSVEEMRLLLN